MKAELTTLLVGLALFSSALCPPSRAAEEGNDHISEIEGTWRWNFTMPDGSAIRPKLVLKIEDGKLTGTASFRSGTETAITNAVLNGNELRFQVIRERDGLDVLTTYTGRWSDKVIKGKIESNWAGQNQTFDWNAQRAHFGVEGVWRWTNSLFGDLAGANARRGGRLETRVDLDQNGEKVTGKTISRSGRPVPIKNGSITNNEVYFEIERTFGDNKFLTKYRGKQTADTIKGTMEMEFNDELREGEWIARRID